MSMHLVNPALTMAGKKKGKKKFASAGAKRKAEQLEREWAELQKKYKPKQPVRKIFKEVSLSPNMSTPRATSSAPSLVTPGGNCALKETPKYTGTQVLGISQMAKSNAVPVFNTDHIVDIARMRR